MSWYERKILYLAYDNAGEEAKSAGFAELYRQKNELLLKIQIKGIGKEHKREAEVSLLTKTESIALGAVYLGGGKEKAEKSFSIKGDRILIGKREIDEEELAGVRLLLDGQQKITGYLRQGKRSDSKRIRQIPSGQNEIFVQEAEQKETGSAYLAAEDKWEELKRSYAVLHPFGDERIFIRIELKDFVIFHSSYQKLVNNSFLLHGFYNYRYLILGQDRELGGEGKDCFYLGVPGTYFEREKMVAVMFGFEGFECEGAVQTGKFGYYMRRVEL